MPLPHLRRRLTVLSLAALVAIGFAGRGFVAAALWSLKFHATAVMAQGTRIHVPLFWTPGKIVGGPNELRLHRANWSLTDSQEWVVLRTNTPALPPDRQRQILQNLTHRIDPSGPGASVYALPADVQSRFQCLAPNVKHFPTWQLSCVSTDGRWALDFFGSRFSRRDLAPVLRSLGSPAAVPSTAT